MKLISCKCPNCGANVKLNEKLEMGTCNFCGAEIINDNFINVNIGGEVVVSNIDVNHEIKMAKSLYKSNDAVGAIDKLKIVLEKDLFNYEALKLFLEYVFSTYSYFELCENKLFIKKIINRFETIKENNDDKIIEKYKSDFKNKIILGNIVGFIVLTVILAFICFILNNILFV